MPLVPLPRGESSGNNMKAPTFRRGLSHYDIRINGVETPDSWKEYENAVRNWPNVCRAEAVKEVIDKAVMERYEKGERMSQEEIERLSQETWDDLLKKEQGEG